MRLITLPTHTPLSLHMPKRACGVCVKKPLGGTHFDHNHTSGYMSAGLVTCRCGGGLCGRGTVATIPDLHGGVPPRRSEHAHRVDCTRPEAGLPLQCLLQHCSSYDAVLHATVFCLELSSKDRSVLICDSGLVQQRSVSSFLQRSGFQHC